MIEYYYPIKTGSCRSLKEVPSGAVIERVNGRDCFGICEACCKPLLAGQMRVFYRDGVSTHDKCRHPLGLSPDVMTLP